MSIGVPPPGALLGSLGRLLDRIGALLGRLAAFLGGLLGRIGALLGASWAAWTLITLRERACYTYAFPEWMGQF